MPKLNNIQIAERLQKRIEQLERGEEIAAKDVKVLLTDEQMARLDEAWQSQELLRKGKRAVTDEQKQVLGWKSKREVRLEAFRQAVAELDGNVLQTLRNELHKKTVRQSRIYLDTYFEALDEGVGKHQAQGRANNALTRAGLARIDGASINQISKRDKEVREMEDRLRKQLGLDGENKDGDA
jgi:energy-coupling factor transporter ATP-binding protein EcfA2